MMVLFKRAKIAYTLLSIKALINQNRNEFTAKNN